MKKRLILSPFLVFILMGCPGPIEVPPQTAKPQFGSDLFKGVWFYDVSYDEPNSGTPVNFHSQLTLDDSTYVETSHYSINGTDSGTQTEKGTLVKEGEWLVLKETHTYNSQEAKWEPIPEGSMVVSRRFTNCVAEDKLYLGAFRRDGQGSEMKGDWVQSCTDMEFKMTLSDTAFSTSYRQYKDGSWQPWQSASYSVTAQSSDRSTCLVKSGESTILQYLFTTLVDQDVLNIGPWGLPMVYQKFLVY